MKKVAIPYSVQDNALSMQPVAWPEQCPCCRSKNVSARYDLSHQAEQTTTSTGTQTKTSFYPLNWSVPYCPTCLDHAQTALKLRMVAFGVWVVLALILFAALISSIQPLSVGVRVVAFLLILGVPILPSILLNKLLTRRIVASKMNSECVQGGYAVIATSQGGKIVFAFDDDDYAALFAALNGAVAE